MFELIEGGLQNSIPFSTTFERKVNKSVPLELHICQMVPLYFGVKSWYQNAFSS